MNVLVVGDSFCEYSDSGTWPNFLQSKLNATVKCVGVGGCSNYTILENFKKHISSNFDVIIVLVSNPYRIPKVTKGNPYLSNWLPNHPSWKTKWNKDLPPGYEAAVESYLDFFFDESFLDWVSANVLKDIESSISSNQTIIWCSALYKDFDKFNPSKGIKVRGQLSEYSLIECTEWCEIPWETYNAVQNGDARKNHFTALNQNTIADFFKNIIEKYQSNNLTREDLDLKNANWVTDKSMLIPQMYSRSRPK